MLLIAFITAMVIVVTSLIVGYKTNDYSFIFWLKMPISYRLLRFVHRVSWLVTLPTFFVTILLLRKDDLCLAIVAGVMLTVLWGCAILTVCWLCYGFCKLIENVQPIWQGFIEWFKSEE